MFRAGVFPSRITPPQIRSHPSSSSETCSSSTQVKIDFYLLMSDRADIMAVTSAAGAWLSSRCASRRASQLSLTDQRYLVASAIAAIEWLPSELLQAVWIQLDDPAAWTQTCKRFRELSKDTLWRAKWFMQRYKVFEVIFYAIARSKVFKPELLEYLIRLGAPLSRNLLQLVYLMRNTAACVELEFVPCNSAANDLTGEGSEWPRWGRIDLSSYAAVLCHGARLVSTSFKPTHT